MDASATMMTVVARWRVKQGHLGDVLAHVAELRTASRAEPGCLEYDAFQSLEAPDTLFLIERYRGVASLEAHRQSPHYGALVAERILPLLAERNVELLQPCLPLPPHR